MPTVAVVSFVLIKSIVPLAGLALRVSSTEYVPGHLAVARRTCVRHRPDHARQRTFSHDVRPPAVSASAAAGETNQHLFDAGRHSTHSADEYDHTRRSCSFRPSFQGGRKIAKRVIFQEAWNENFPLPRYRNSDALDRADATRAEKAGDDP
jgi:hypothetical protein